jgi:hypothetical protein
MAHGPWTRNTLARISINATCQGQAVVNVFHFEASAVAEATMTSDAVAQAWLTTLLGDFNTSVMTQWLATHGAVDYSVAALNGQVLERPANVSHALVSQDYTTGYPRVGGIAGNQADDMTTACVVKWRGVLAGKSHRGRTYIGPLADTHTDLGKIVSAFATVVTTWKDAMITRYNAGTGTNTTAFLTVYSRPYDKYDYSYVVGSGSDKHVFFPEDYDGNSSGILTGSVDTIARTQRRRQIGVGA